MTLKFKGKAWVFGDNLDVDNEIFPFRKRELGLVKPGEEWKFVMTNVDPDFPTKAKRGDIVVAGTNFGCGHGHIDGLNGFIQMGISCLIVESINRGFFRNSIHSGLPIIDYPGITKMVKEGDVLEVDLKVGEIKNVTTGKTVKFKPLPDFLLEILDAGGIDPYGANLAKQEKAMSKK